MKGGLPVICIRLLILIYALQSANVGWNGAVSDFFSSTNGVKQGGVLSAILYCFYCNDLLKYLREKKSGCWVNGHYMGIPGYNDDNLLISPSRRSLQNMSCLDEIHSVFVQRSFCHKCVVLAESAKPISWLDFCPAIPPLSIQHIGL